MRSWPQIDYLSSAITTTGSEFLFAYLIDTIGITCFATLRPTACFYNIRGKCPPFIRPLPTRYHLRHTFAVMRSQLITADTHNTDLSRFDTWERCNSIGNVPIQLPKKHADFCFFETLFIV